MSQPIDYNSHIERICNEIIQGGDGFVLESVLEGVTGVSTVEGTRPEDIKKMMLERPDKENVLYRLVQAKKQLEELIVFYNTAQELWAKNGLSNPLADIMKMLDPNS